MRVIREAGDGAIREVRVGKQAAVARGLFEEYASGLGIDLGFQGFEAELGRLGEMYGPPHGCLLLGLVHGHAQGCVAVRRLAGGDCEMKRLYVRAAARGTGLGRRLAQAAVDAGRALGYDRIVLDTLVSMTAARALYASLGFREIAPYYDNPIPGARFLGLDLR